MNKSIIALLFTFFTISANAGSLDNLALEVDTKTTHPNQVIKESKDKDFWFAYSIPVQEGTISSCCWNKKNDYSVNSQMCDLNKKHRGYGSSDKSPMTSTNKIFIHIKNTEVAQILPVGESCQVIAKDIKVKWLENISQNESINYLTQLIKSQKESSSQAIHALALHDSPFATDKLYEVAMTKTLKASRDAIFWLGEIRKDGLPKLKKLYKDLPKGSIRQSINFALSQMNTEESLDFLAHIATTDENKKQRNDALFWLAEKRPKFTKDIIFKNLQSDNKNNDIDHLVFALSQLKGGEGAKALFELIKGNYSDTVKKKSLFWLSQSEDEGVINKLQSLL